MTDSDTIYQNIYIYIYIYNNNMTDSDTKQRACNIQYNHL